MMQWLSELRFETPWAFLLMIVPVSVAVWHLLRGKRRYPTLKLSTLAGVTNTRPTLRARIKPHLFWIQALGYTALTIALARPQLAYSDEKIETEGVDIVIALDVSGSMRAKDFQPNRLEAAKAKASAFIEARKADRIGLVIFAGESFTQCPSTTDHKVLLSLLALVRDGMLADRTAIGMGLGTAVDRLRESDAKSKVIILLTDGVNNAGFIAPATAAEAAASYNIRVYTIGIGTRGKAPMPVPSIFGETYQDVEVEIDEELLQEIAGLTGGKYFRATNNQSLAEVYSEIDRMETSRMEVSIVSRTTELFVPFLLAGFLLLLLEWILRHSWLRSYP